MKELLVDFNRLFELLEGLRKDVDHLTATSNRLREETNKLSILQNKELKPKYIWRCTDCKDPADDSQTTSVFPQDEVQCI
ncbi:hypothetical protein [Fictibacillus phosphorivorans]|uniref:hypothetical protein n=1 Tax=Fictibacillus phosphorivorans TaxID=1221500 RepID=UPI002040424B|nr:hypothetical protein [Fictibacillus phosphorivorans]MCM3718500.1 hypothetical protein [Fictibacillus phosphorivorans]MCM3776144.1 hypothetical protein [Fictibacillus phosphorivorans]